MVDKFFDDQAVQKQIDEIAEKAGLDSVLIMKSHDTEMEVVLSGGEKGKTIYHTRDRGKKSTHPQGKHALYCEKVVDTRTPLEVQDASADDEWKNNEDLTEFGLGTYYGLPIEQDGKVVGTVCALHHESYDFDNKNYNVKAELSKLKQSLENKS